MRIRSLVTRTALLGLALVLLAPLGAFASLPPLGANPILGRTFGSPVAISAPIAPASVTAVPAIRGLARLERPFVFGVGARATKGRMASASSRVLSVIGTSVYSDGLWMWGDGLLANTGTDPVTNVTVTAVFLDASNNELGREAVYPTGLPMYVIDPGDSAAFSWGFMWWETAPPEGTVNYRFEAQGEVAPEGVTSLLLPTQLVTTTTDSYGWRHYTVSVTNDRPDDVTATIVTGYERLGDGSDSFVDAMSSSRVVGRRLLPGQTVQVELLGTYTPAGTLDTPVLRAEAKAVTFTAGLNLFEPVRICPYGGTATVDGRLLDVDLHAVVGATMTMKTSVDGRKWKTLTPVLTDATGRFSFSVKPGRRTLCTVSTPGVPAKTVAAIPFAALSEPTMPSHAGGGRAFAVSGTLKPKHTAGSKAVRIETVFVDASGVESTGPVFWAKAANYKTYSKYAGALTFKKKGVWVVRATIAGDSLHAATATSWHAVLIGETTLSLKTNRTQVSYANAATLSATLRDARKLGVKGRKVVLEQYDSGTGTFVDVKTATTNAAGVAKFSVKPWDGAVYHTRFDGDDASYASNSSTLLIKSGRFGLAGSGQGPMYTINSVKLAAGWHEVVFYNYAASQAQFGLTNAALTKWAYHWYAPAGARTAKRIHLKKAAYYHLAWETYSDYLIYVW